MRGVISKGGRRSLVGWGAGIRRTLNGHEVGNDGYGQGDAPTFLALSATTTRGQGVHREVGSEGLAEKYRAVVEGAILMTNRSAEDGNRSSLHYGGEGVLIRPIVPRCVRTARYGRSGRDPRRPRSVPGWHRDKGPYKSKDEVGNEAGRGVGPPNSTGSTVKAVRSRKGRPSGPGKAADKGVG